MAIANIKNQGVAASNLPNSSQQAGSSASQGAAQSSAGANLSSAGATMGADSLLAGKNSKEAQQSARVGATNAATKAALAGYDKAAKSSPSVKEAANVQISQKAKDLSLIKKTMNETADVREDKIAKFKDLIASGNYKPDAGKIADGILKEAIMDDLSKTPDVALED